MLCAHFQISCTNLSQSFVKGEKRKTEWTFNFRVIDFYNRLEERIFVWFVSFLFSGFQDVGCRWKVSENNMKVMLCTFGIFIYAAQAVWEWKVIQRKRFSDFCNFSLLFPNKLLSSVVECRLKTCIHKRISGE